MASTNEILGSIYRTLLSVDQKLSEAQKNSGKGIKNNQPNWFGFTQPQTKTDTGKFTDFANGIKALNGIKFTDIVKVSIAPLGLVAAKINSFYEKLGDMDKERIGNAKKSIEGLIEILTFIEKSNHVKLWTSLFFFPTKRLTKFIDNLSGINKENIDNALGTIDGFTNLLKKINETTPMGASYSMRLYRFLLLFPDKQLTKFIDNLSGINKRNIDNALGTIKGFTNILKQLDKASNAKAYKSTKLYTFLLTFPDKRLKEFIDNLSGINKRNIDNALDNTKGFENLVEELNKSSNTKIFKSIKLSAFLSTFPDKRLKEFIDNLSGINKRNIDNALDNTKGFTNILKQLDKASNAKAYKSIKLSAFLSTFPNEKLKEFIDNLSIIDKKNITNAKKSIEGFTEILKYIEDTKNVKLWASIGLFPTKKVEKYIDDLQKIYKKLDKFDDLLIKSFTPIQTNRLKRTAHNLKGFIKDLNSLNASIALGGMAAVVLVPAITVGLISYKLILANINKLVLDVKITGKHVKSSRRAMFNVLLFMHEMTTLLATVALTGIALTAFGGWKAIGLGITMMGISALAILGLSHLVNFVGVQTGSRITKRSLKQMFSFIGSAALLSIAVIGVGSLMMAAGGTKAMWLGVKLMSVSMLGIFALTWLVKFVGTASKKSLPSFKNILLFIGASMLMSAAIIGLGAITTAVGWDVVKNGIKITGMSLLMVGGIALIAKFAGDAAKKAFLPMLGIIVLGGLMQLLSLGMVKLGQTIEEAGGWPTIGNALGVVAATIGEMTVITLAIGGLMMIPVLPIVMGAGIATLTGLGIAFLTVTSAAKKMVEIGRDVKTNEIKTSSETTSAFIDAMKEMITGIGGIPLRQIGKAIAAMIPVRNLINSMAIFANLLYNFAGDPGYLKVKIGTDKDGNPIFDRKGIDVKKASESISNGFKTFIETVIPAVSNAHAETIKARAVRRINGIMEPVSKFASILQAFVMDETDGSKIQIAHYNEKGELVRGQVIDIPKIGEALGSGFGTFVHEIFSRMDVVEQNMVSRGTIKKINNLMKPVTSFVDIVSMFEGASDNKLKKVIVDEEGKITETKEIDLVAIGNTIANNFDSFVTVVSNSLVSVEGISADGAKKKIEVLRKLTDGISGFAEQLEKSFSSDEELAKFKKNSDEINSALRNVGELYKSSLDEKMSKGIPTLKKNHHDFLNALEKDTKSVKKPLQEYVNLLKEINTQYSKLVPYAESLNKNSVTFVLDQGTKYETKMDDDAVQKIADAYSENLSPIIKDAIAEVIDSITATPVYKSDKTLQQITFDAAVGSI